MNPSNEKTTGNRRSAKGKLSAGGGLIGVLIVVYAILQPILSRQLGIELPKIPLNSASNSTQVEPEPPRNQTSGEPRIATRIDRSSDAEARQTPAAPSRVEMKASTDSQNIPSVQSTKKATGGGPLSNRIRPPPTDKSDSSEKLSPTKSAPDTRSAPAADPNLRYGILQSIGRDNYISPAGLRYTPGSEEGHRLKHLERHTEDQPGRPGKHGVFDGGMEKTLEVLDRAYEKAKKGGHGTTKSVDDGRTIYTVDMGGRIGFIGGRDGNRRRKPMARRVRLVLDGNRVITAYPL